MQTERMSIWTLHSNDWNFRVSHLVWQQRLRWPLSVSVLIIAADKRSVFGWAGRRQSVAASECSHSVLVWLLSVEFASAIFRPPQPEHSRRPVPHWMHNCANAVAPNSLPLPAAGTHYRGLNARWGELQPVLARWHGHSAKAAHFYVFDLWRGSILVPFVTSQILGSSALVAMEPRWLLGCENCIAAGYVLHCSVNSVCSSRVFVTYSSCSSQWVVVSISELTHFAAYFPLSPEATEVSMD